MAVVCPNCGAQYDATLFEFGRTVSCRCGRRVGLPLRVPWATSTKPQRFLADEMLGGLARWLRVIGYDTVWRRRTRDRDLVLQALGERRILLTRDRNLVASWWLDACYLVRNERPLEQLREVVTHFDLDWRKHLLRRCTICNAALVPLSPSERPPGIPPAVAARTAAFRRCPSCERIYWEGSHTARMRNALERALDGA
ncbi:MAG: hypothetical protein D6815_04360 [Candidatus Dadabacteria bacterium]|nr:MAG: hypothetical protein D6815_04360 [Candidatus Dadabacteria bacterium]